MSSYRPPATAAQRRHHAAAVAHAERHFTDPDMKAKDAAIRHGISDRVLRDSLKACSTSWRTITSELRMTRAQKLLAETKYEISAVARMCGYRSPPAFANAFAQHNGASPAQWRVRRGGPARAGGPTGAFYTPAARTQALKAGEEPPPNRRGSMTPGEHAIQSCEIDEAHARIADFGHSGAATPSTGFSRPHAAAARWADNPCKSRRSNAHNEATVSLAQLSRLLEACQEGLE